MTDKEWYAHLSTIVLEGIELVNKDADYWEIYKNQNSLKEFIWKDQLPDQRKKEAIKSAKQCITNIMMWGGFVTAGVIMFFDVIIWTDIFLGDSRNVLSAILLLATSVAMSAIGVIGNYYDALL